MASYYIFLSVLLMPHLIAVTAQEVEPVRYYIRPVDAALLDNCVFVTDALSDSFQECNESALLLDSVHGPQPFFESARDQYYIQVVSNYRILFQFASPVDIDVVQIYYYVSTTPNPSQFLKSRVTLYNVNDGEHRPWYPIPVVSVAPQIVKFDDFAKDTNQFGQVCINVDSAEGDNVENLLVAISSRDTEMYFSEVNFFTGTPPAGVCDGEFLPVMTTSESTTVSTTAESTTSSPTTELSTTPSPITPESTTPESTTPESTTVSPESTTAISTTSASPKTTTAKDVQPTDKLPTKSTENKPFSVEPPKAFGLSSSAEGAIVAVIVIVVILIVLVAIILAIVLIVSRNQRTYEVAKANAKSHSHEYVAVPLPVSPQSLSEDSSQDQSQRDSKVTVDFKVTEEGNQYKP